MNVDTFEHNPSIKWWVLLLPRKSYVSKGLTIDWSRYFVAAAPLVSGTYALSDPSRCKLTHRSRVS
jgi:hypothetical protein